MDEQRDSFSRRDGGVEAREAAGGGVDGGMAGSRAADGGVVGSGAVAAGLDRSGRRGLGARCLDGGIPRGGDGPGGGWGTAAALMEPGRPRRKERPLHGGEEAHSRDLRSRVAAMRAGGMSATAIRRALGLSAREAVAAGVESPIEWRQALARPVNPAAPAAPRYDADGRRHDLRMTDVMDAVCEVTGIGPERLLGRAQDRRHAGARHLLMHLLRELCTGASYPTIGFFLQRDHTTVLYGCRRARGLIEHDRQFRALYHRVREALEA